MEFDLHRRSFGFCFAENIAVGLCGTVLGLDRRPGNCSSNYQCCYIKNQDDPFNVENEGSDSIDVKDDFLAHPQCGTPGASGALISAQNQVPQQVLAPQILLRSGEPLPSLTVPNSSARQFLPIAENKRVGKILGGIPVTGARFCWIAAITMDSRYIAVGTIVSSQYVLTTATTMKK